MSDMSVLEWTCSVYSDVSHDGALMALTPRMRMGRRSVDEVEVNGVEFRGCGREVYLQSP